MDNASNVIVEQAPVESVDATWTSKILAIGGVLGAVTGLAAAYLLVQRSRKMGERPTLELGEGIKLGVLIFGLLRSVDVLGERS